MGSILQRGRGDFNDTARQTARRARRSGGGLPPRCLLLEVQAGSDVQAGFDILDHDPDSGWVEMLVAGRAGQRAEARVHFKGVISATGKDVLWAPSFAERIAGGV